MHADQRRRTFGSGKFIPNMRKSLLLGYVEGTTSSIYKLFDVDKKTIFTSGSVDFDETQFPEIIIAEAAQTVQRLAQRIMQRPEEPANEDMVLDTIYVRHKDPVTQDVQPNRQSAQDTEPLRWELATPAEDLHQDGTAYDAAEEVRPRKRRRTEDVMPERTTRSGCRIIVPQALVTARPIINDEEPLTYKEAINGPEGPQWHAAIDEQLHSLKKLGVHTTLRCGMGIRRNPAGKVIKSKATSAAFKAASAIDKVIASK